MSDIMANIGFINQLIRKILFVFYFEWFWKAILAPFVLYFTLEHVHLLLAQRYCKGHLLYRIGLAQRWFFLKEHLLYRIGLEQRWFAQHCIFGGPNAALCKALVYMLNHHFSRPCLMLKRPLKGAKKVQITVTSWFYYLII